MLSRMDPSAWQTLLDSVNALGVLGLLVVALVGAYRRWYVFRPEFEDERADKLEWKAIALEALGAANQAVGVAEKVVK